jgi:hypothetical protein
MVGQLIKLAEALPGSTLAQTQGRMFGPTTPNRPLNLIDATA